MAYDKRCDCANSGTGVKAPTDATPGERLTLTCTRCKTLTYATVGTDGHATLFTHLRPGKTLADRR